MRTTILFSAMALAFGAVAAERVSSPDGRLVVDFDMANGGVPTYSVSFAGEQIVKPSKMGFVLADATRLDRDFSVVGVTRDSQDETWTPVWGENATIRNHYNSLTIDMAKPDTA